MPAYNNVPPPPADLGDYADATDLALRLRQLYPQFYIDVAALPRQDSVPALRYTTFRSGESPHLFTVVTVNVSTMGVPVRALSSAAYANACTQRLVLEGEMLRPAAAVGKAPCVFDMNTAKHGYLLLGFLPHKIPDPHLVMGLMWQQRAAQHIACLHGLGYNFTIPLEKKPWPYFDGKKLDDLTNCGILHSENAKILENCVFNLQKVARALPHDYERPIHGNLSPENILQGIGPADGRIFVKGFVNAVLSDPMADLSAIVSTTLVPQRIRTIIATYHSYEQSAGYQPYERLCMHLVWLFVRKFVNALHTERRIWGKESQDNLHAIDISLELLKDSDYVTKNADLRLYLDNAKKYLFMLRESTADIMPYHRANEAIKALNLQRPGGRLEQLDSCSPFFFFYRIRSAETDPDPFDRLIQVCRGSEDYVRTNPQPETEARSDAARRGLRIYDVREVSGVLVTDYNQPGTTDMPQRATWQQP